MSFFAFFQNIMIKYFRIEIKNKMPIATDILVQTLCPAMCGSWVILYQNVICQLGFRIFWKANFMNEVHDKVYVFGRRETLNFSSSWCNHFC